MIISHKYKYIFAKPRKVAGSSIQIALAKHCGPDDVVTPMLFKKEIDADGVKQEDYARNHDKYFNHMKPYRLKHMVGRDVWDEYFTFSIVRNPWDMLVSRFFWNKKGAAPMPGPMGVLKEVIAQPLNPDRYGKLINTLWRDLRGKRLKPDDTFEDFMKKLPSNVRNTPFYFDSRGHEEMDMVLRFEHLDEDYKLLCEKIGIPYEPLPQLKTKTRKSRDYREFYTPELRDWVAREFAKEIDYFGYTFE
jgi:hypothetical protein